MDGKLKKCEKDLESLIVTMENLKKRNEKLKVTLIDEKLGHKDLAKKNELKGRLNVESTEMWERKSELEKVYYEIVTGEQTLKEKVTQVCI